MGEAVCGVTEQLGEHATGANHQHLPKLSIDGHAYDDFGYAIGDHLLDEQIGRRVFSRCAAASASAGVRMLTTTAPSSDLCSRWAPEALMTTGKPISCAAFAASVGATTLERGTLTPKAARAALPACSVRVRAGCVGAVPTACWAIATQPVAPAAHVSPTSPARFSASSASRCPCRGMMLAARHFSRVAGDIDSGMALIRALRVGAPG